MFMLNANTKQHLSSTLISKVEGYAMVITSTLETLPTHIVTLPLASLRLLRSFYFELLTLSNQNGIQCPRATRSTSKVHINIMYIKYTSVDFASLLIYQASRVALPQ